METWHHTGRMKLLQRFEWLLPAGAGLCLLSCTLIVSPHRPMWLDEVYTYYAVAHDSFGAFLRSYATNVNATPPLYFVVSWAVLTVMPLSALSLRICSSLACGVAVFFIWATLRRHTGFFVASAATLTDCLTSDLFLTHNAEARFYGLYLALVAWETYNYDRICADVPPSSGRLFSNGLSHGLALSCTHVAGFYSFAILLSLLIRDWALRAWRPKVYLSVLAGWLPVLFYAPMIWSQRGATSWMPRPGRIAIFSPFNLGLHAYFVLCAFAGLVAVAFLRKHYNASLSDAALGNHAETKEWLHLVILAFTFLAVPYCLLLVSWAGLPLLLDRYALPSLIGVALLFGFLCAGLFGDLFETPLGSEINPKSVLRLSERLFRAGLLAGLLAYPLARAISAAGDARGMQGASQSRAPEHYIDR